MGTGPIVVYGLYLSTIWIRMYVKNSNFPDNTKVNDIVDSEDGYETLQQGLDLLCKWAEEC